jgi:hypothetical protein
LQEHALLGLKQGYVVSSARERYAIGADVEVVPWTDVVHRRVDFGLGARGTDTLASIRKRSER